LGVKTYDCGAISVGVFDPTNGYAYGFALTVDAGSENFYYHLSAGFQANSYSMKMLNFVDYEDANGCRICYTGSDARGSGEHAFGKKAFEDGTVYYGELENGEPSGYGLYYRVDGGYLGGLTVDGALNGWGVLVRADGTGFMGTFVDNKLDGYAYYFDENGDAYLCMYDENEFVEKLNDGAPLTRAQTSLPPEVLVNDLGTQGLVDGEDSSTPGGYEDGDQICSRCGGSGRVTCSECGGSGYKYSTYHVNDDGSSSNMRLDCGGCTSGMARCPSCSGDGKK
jgi:hypothetical protein